MISIIVPFKNTDIFFINRLIDSIVIQKVDDYELIFINDNSNNGFNYKSEIEKRGFIYLEYESISLGFNLGQVRDYGVKHAKGDYIWFVDSDDILVNGSLKKILSYFEKHKDIDLVFFDYINFNNYNTNKVKLNNNYFYVDFSNNKWNRIVVTNFLYKFQSDWRVCFRKEFLIRNSISHGECRKKFEDVYYSIIYKNFIKKCIITSECFYLYDTSRNSSILNSLEQKERCLSRIEPIYMAVDFLKDNNKITSNFYYTMNYYTSFFMHKKFSSINERKNIYKKYIKKPYKYQNLRTLGLTRKWLANNIFIFIWILTGRTFVFKSY